MLAPKTITPNVKNAQLPWGPIKSINKATKASAVGQHAANLAINVADSSIPYLSNTFLDSQSLLEVKHKKVMKNCFWVFVLVGQLVSAAVIDHIAFFGSTGSLNIINNLFFFESDQSFKTLFVFLIK